MRGYITIFGATEAPEHRPCFERRNPKLAAEIAAGKESRNQRNNGQDNCELDFTGVDAAFAAAV